MSGSRDISNVAENNLSLNIRIEQLFHSSRILEKNNIYKIILYFPFGLILVLFRSILYLLGFIILSVLPRTSTIRCNVFNWFCKLLGLVIQADDKYLDNTTKLLIANHVSILDRLAVNAVIPCNIISKNFQVETNSLSVWQDGDINHLKEPSDNDISALQKSITDSPFPSLCFPEYATTSGTVGFLKFHPTVFLLNVSVQPVLIQVSLSSLVNVCPSFLGSTVWSDLFWLFFFPSSVFTLKVLPSIAQLPEESAYDFCKRIQQIMANAAVLKPTVYTYVDKADFVKQWRRLSSVTGSARYDSSKFLSQDPVTKTGDSHSQLTLNTAAKTFGKSPTERMLSYQERKALLIAAAKQKYLKKHSLL